MKNRYDNVPGKEAANAKVMQGRLKAEHSANDAFVKKQQAELSKYAGKAPTLKPESKHFNAYMCNNGEHAQELAKGLMKGADKTAFPVK